MGGILRFCSVMHPRNNMLKIKKLKTMGGQCHLARYGLQGTSLDIIGGLAAAWVPVEREKQCPGREIVGTIRQQFLEVLPVSSLLSVA